MNSNNENSPNAPVGLLLEECLAGRRVVAELRRCEIPVCTTAEVVAPGASDRELLDRLAARPDLVLVLLEHDLPAHTTIQSVLRSCGGRACVISGSKRLAGAQIAALLGAAWPRLRRLARRGRRPFVALLAPNGTLTTLRGVV